MIYETVFIAPNTDIASSLNHTYDRDLSPPRTVAFSVWSQWSGRAKTIYVLPMPKDFDEDMRHNFEASIRDTSQCRLQPGGKLIWL
jgi:hypothetical protein